MANMILYKFTLRISNSSFCVFFLCAQKKRILRRRTFHRRFEAGDWRKVSGFSAGDKEVVILIVLRRVAGKLFDCPSLAAPFLDPTEVGVAPSPLALMLNGA